MGALATGAIAAAVLVPSTPSITNVIGTGHLRIAVNHGRGSTLDFANLAPGESRTGDQLVSGDLAGIRAANLVLTLSDVRDDPVAHLASLTVLSGDPEAADSVRFVDGVCTPAGGYVHRTTYTALATLAAPQQVSLGILNDDHSAVCVRYRLTFDIAAGNSVQGASAGFALDYTLTQAPGNSP